MYLHLHFYKHFWQTHYPSTLLFPVKPKLLSLSQCFLAFLPTITVSDSHMRRSKSIVNLLGEMSSENYLGEANTNNDQSDKIQGTVFKNKHCKICHLSCDFNKSFEFSCQDRIII